MYAFTDRDIATLKTQNDAAITAARNTSSVDDDELAHLYELRGKLNKITSTRADAPAKPSKSRKPRAVAEAS